MAKNTYKKNTAREEQVEKPKRELSLGFLKDRRLHLSLGLLSILFSIFLFTAQLSYLFTGTADQSVVESVWDPDIITNGQEVDNWLGLLGAYAAHVFVYKWFGIASFLFPPVFFLIGFRTVFRKSLVPIRSAIWFSFFFILWVSATLGYMVHLASAEEGPAISFLSGAIGYEIALIFDGVIGWGTVLLLLFTFLVFIIFFFNISEFVINKPSEVLDDIDDNQQDGIETGQVVFGEEVVEDGNWVIREVEPKPEYESDPEVDLEPEEESLEPVGSVLHEGPTLEIEPHAPEEETKLEIAPVIEEKVGDKLEHYDPTLDLPSYQFPTLELLNEYEQGKVQVTKEELEQNKDKIVETLSHYSIGIASIKATIGPTVTLYEIVPDAGIRISKIKNLEDDIALSLAALGIRIIAPIPGKGTIGIEVPNKNREMVSARSVFSTEKFQKTDKELPVALGKTISNEVLVIDLAKMPHLLMAGATGQGKSVGLNILITSLIYKKHPSQLKFVLIDPKKVELTLFNKIERHFLAVLPGSEDAIITDSKKVIHTLNSLCMEMDDRYNLLKDAECRNLKEYNRKFVERRLNPNHGHRFLPYIVLIIDELADLMMTAGKEVETPIARLAQLARAIGIHLVVATQRPSVNVITGIIKANFPARLSFKVTSKIDSRTILDTGGADQLVGMGDMLLSTGADLTRLQCAFVDTPEVERVCEFIGSQRGYPTAYQLPEYIDENEEGMGDFDFADRDPMFEDAARIVVSNQQGSTSLLQRRLKLGYNRAGRLIDQLEAVGVVGPFEGSKAREVLIRDELSLEQLLSDLQK